MHAYTRRTRSVVHSLIKIEITEIACGNPQGLEEDVKEITLFLYMQLSPPSSSHFVCVTSRFVLPRTRDPCGTAADII